MTSAVAPPRTEREPDPDRREYVRLVEVDSDLADAIPAEDRALARRRLVAAVHQVEPGDPSVGECALQDCIGLLVVDGFLTRDVAYAGQRSRELLGTGDLLRPADLEEDFLPPYSESTFTVLEPTTVAALNLRLLAVGIRWPRFVDELMHRTLRRSRWLAIRLAINNVTRVDERLLLFFWHAAGRWGRVTPDGVALPFTLTHELLAQLVGAQRPSVTTALSRLRAERQLRFRSGPRGSGSFVLLGDPPGNQT
jgi:CRP/FNR family cyclic AMP-dependent transcriptional regulator